MMSRTAGELPLRSNLLRLGLMALAGVLAVLAIVCSLLASRYQQRLIEASRYNGAFDLSQASVELLRLQIAMEEELRDAPSPQIGLRYNILKNRIAVDEQNGFVRNEKATTFRELGRVLDGIGAPDALAQDKTALAAAVEQLRPFAGQLLRLSSNAHSRSGDMVLGNQQALHRVLVAIWTITLTLVCVGGALIALVLWQYRRLDRVARTDNLTGLANRAAFNQVLMSSKLLHRAVVLLDVDHFKATNDSLGHDAGDQLLRSLALRLRAAARDAAIVARIGGDEFAALFAGPRAAADSVAFAESMAIAARQPVMHEGREIMPSMTQGLCIARDGGQDDVLKDADIALYAAKLAGRGGYLGFEPAMKEAFERRQRLLEDLRQAVLRNEFFLLYQPVVDLEGGEPRGFEALLRWLHPEFGLIFPADFVPLAEESGLIHGIGRWVVDEACRQAAAWPPSLFVAVNVSARQLADDGFAAHVASCLRTHRLSRGRLEIEITESVFIDNNGAALSALNDIRALGCPISLDDFGTGYASLSYLRRFRFDKLKIDQSFVRGPDTSGENIVIVSTICDLARRLGLTIVAEGIETAEQRERLREAGSHLGQGYHFHRPMSAAAISHLLDQASGSQPLRRSA